MSYSIDFIKRTVAYKQEGHTLKQLREAFGIPSETYYDWKRKLDSGYYEIKVRRERNRKIDKAALKQAVAGKPDAFLKEYAEPFNGTAAAIWLALKKLNITRKKDVCVLRKIRRETGGVYGAGKKGLEKEPRIC